MDALRQINRDFGITVLCNLHAVDLAREYCDRLIGMSDGRIVFDGAPSALTAAVADRLYGAGGGDEPTSEPPLRPPADTASAPSRAGRAATLQSAGVPGLARPGALE